MKEVNNLLNRLGELDDAPLIWVNKKVYDMAEEIEKLNNDIKVLLKENENKEKVIKAQDNIIKEVRGKLYDLNYKIKEIHNVPFDITEIFEIIDLLDKENNNDRLNK